MFLDSNKKLVAVLTAAKTTLNIPVTVDYVDLTTTTTTPSPFQTYTNGVTPVDILVAPAASTIRKVNEMEFYGRDTAVNTIRIYTIDSTPTTGLINAGSFVAGNDYQIVFVGTTDFTLIGASANTVGVIFTATGVGTGSGTAATAYQHVDLQIQSDDTLCYTDANGWYAIDSSGNLKSVQAASATAIATAIHGATNKTTPVGADELGIWDSVTGLLNKVSFTNLWAQLSGLYAALAGSAAQVFSVAPATLPAHAVRLDQMPQFPFRNRIINGDMSVSQVNGGTAVTPTAGMFFVTDQWQTIVSQASKLTFQQVADAPAGLKYSTKISVASQFSPGAADYFIFTQNLEGQNLIDFQFGTSGAVTIVTSQWIKGSVAGTYSVTVRNGAANRSYVGTVNVTTAWQRLSISLVGDTAGVWATDNITGLIVTFDLGSGSNFNATAGTWQAGNFFRTSGSVTFVNQVVGSTLNITGVQVEAVPTGSTQPTAFEFLPYETQLRRAQRYLPAFSYANLAPVSIGQAIGATNAYVDIKLPVTTRIPVTGVTPSAAASFSMWDAGSILKAASAIAFQSANTDMASISVTCATGLVAGSATKMVANTTALLYFTGAQL
jgi:hypothetical protein